MKTVKVLASFACIFFLILECLSDSEYLYYSSAGNRDAEKPGIWAGAVEGDNKGFQNSLQQSGFHCIYFEGQTKFAEGFPTKSVSYDPVAERMLILVESEKLTLVEGSLCVGPKVCLNDTNGVLFYEVPYQDRGVITAVGQYNGNVYFIYEDSSSNPPNANEKVVNFQLRVFDKKKGCTDFPYSTYKDFQLMDCSTVLAKIREDRYRRYQSLETASQLLVQKKKNKATFFIMLLKSNIEKEELQSLEMELVFINENGSPRILHSTVVDNEFKQWTIDHLGGISYREGRLCWSAIDKIHCGNWDISTSTLTNIITILKADDIAKACKGAQNILKTVSTGLAIANTEDLSVYFGCVASQDFGGGGYGVAPKDSEPAKVYPLLSNNSTVRADSMFLVDYCVNGLSPKTGANTDSAPCGYHMLHPGLILVSILTQILLQTL